MKYGPLTDFIQKHREGVMYLFWGAGSVVVSWLSYALFVWAGIDPSVSNAISWVCAVLFAFVTNKWFVFLSRSLKKEVFLKELGSFFMFRIVTGVISILLFPVLFDLGMDQELLGVEGFPAKIAVSIIEIALNYLFSKFYVFRVKKENAEDQEEEKS